MGKTLFGKTFTFFGKTIMPILRQSLYLQGSTFDFYRTYFSQTLLIQGYLLTYHFSRVLSPKPVWHFSWRFVLDKLIMFFGQINRLPFPNISNMFFEVKKINDKMLLST